MQPHQASDPVVTWQELRAMLERYEAQRLQISSYVLIAREDGGLRFSMTLQPDAPPADTEA